MRWDDRGVPPSVEAKKRQDTGAYRSGHVVAAHLEACSYLFEYHATSLHIVYVK